MSASVGQATFLGARTLDGVSADESPGPVVAPARPAGLIAATTVLVAEALTLLGFAGWMILRHGSETPSNEQVYSGSVAYLLVFGAMVTIVAVSLWQLRGWAFGAAVFLQVLALPIAWQMATEGLWVGAAPLAVAAIVASYGLMTAPTRQILGRNRWGDSDQESDR